eukprot:1947695-Pleurochrysis_carterae.AAC.1
MQPLSGSRAVAASQPGCGLEDHPLAGTAGWALQRLIGRPRPVPLGVGREPYNWKITPASLQPV